MTGDYPRFNATYTHEELVEHFLLSPDERALVDTCRGEANRHGVAVLLKTVQYLETIASLPGFGMVPEGHFFYSSGPNMRTRRIKPCSVRVCLDPIPAQA